MRGDAERQANMLLAVTPDCFISDDHPIRSIKPIVESALARLSSLFEAMYAERGRPSIPPEHLLKASLLIALYSIRSERQFCERLRYDLLFKWFLGFCQISDNDRKSGAIWGGETALAESGGGRAATRSRARKASLSEI